MISKSFKKITIDNKEYDFADISNIKDIEKIPYTYRILIENIIRQNLLSRNDNAEAQVVISGLKNDIEESLEIFLENGAKKALQLSVSAPFHCPLMKPAKEIMLETIKNVNLMEPLIPVLSNVKVNSEKSVAI